jgi:hypothetical protein
VPADARAALRRAWRGACEVQREAFRSVVHSEAIPFYNRSQVTQFLRLESRDAS